MVSEWHDWRWIWATSIRLSKTWHFVLRQNFNNSIWFLCRPHSCSFTLSFIHSFIHTINLSLFFTTLLWAFGLNFKQIPHINCKLYVIMGSPSNQHIPIERPKYTHKESITVSSCRKDLVNTHTYTQEGSAWRQLLLTQSIITACWSPPESRTKCVLSFKIIYYNFKPPNWTASKLELIHSRNSALPYNTTNNNNIGK